jgi:outer membrane protein TolC
MNKTIRLTLCGGVALVCLLAGTSSLLLAQQSSSVATGNVRRLTLSEAVSLALQNNREVRLAEVAAARAEAERQEIHSLFRPQIFAGTGLAATRGFPLSIEGSAPAIFQVSSNQALFNPSLRNSERQAGEMREAAGRSLEGKRDDIAAATVLTYLDLGRARRSLESVRGSAQNYLAAEQIVEERVRAGLDPPIETTRARLNTARSRAEQVGLESQMALLEARLRHWAGIPQTQAILTAPAEVPLGQPDETPDRLISLALERNPGLQALAEEIEAREFAVKSEEATRWPRINLVGQYGLFSKINNFEDYFQRFARHNATLGVSIQVPIYERERHAARLSKVETELAETRYRLENAQGGIAQQIRELWANIEQQTAAREVARLELELARRSVEVALAQFEEGRANRLAIEQARIEESLRWVSLYQAEYRAEATRVELLRVTGEIRSIFR